MLKPVKMKKLHAAILEEKKDAVLRELKEKGIIQLVNVSEAHVSEEPIELASMPASWIRTEANELLNRVDALLDAFKLVELEKSKLDALLREEAKKKAVEETSPEELFEHVRDKLAVVEDRILRITQRLEALKKEKEELALAEHVLTLLQNFGIGPRDLRGYTRVRVLAGSLPGAEAVALQSELSKLDSSIVFHRIEVNKRDSLIILAFFKELDVEISRILRMHRFEEMQIPYKLYGYGLEDAFSKIKIEAEALGKEEQELLSELSRIAGAERENMTFLREQLQVEKYMDEASQHFAKTAKVCVLSGWVPAEAAKEAEETIRRASDNYAVISIENPRKGDKPPTKIVNPKPTEPLEVLTKTYGSPTYGEVDPTSVIAFTFPMIFGLMFGDMGQGALLFLLGYAISFRLKLEDAIKKFGRILMMCGFAAMIGGFVYGSFFGLEGEYAKRFLGFELHPFWKSPLRDIQDLVPFALIFGVLQLTLGCFLNMYNKASHHEPLAAIFNPWGAMGLWVLWGGTFMVLKHGSNIFALVKDITLIPAVLLPLVLIAVGSKYVEGISLGWGVYEAYEAVTRFLFNTISYIRVVAIAVIHAALSLIMVTAMVGMPSTALGGVGKGAIFVAGNLLIFLMETFISFVQTLRLHYYELFSKFFEGEGSEFKPFKVVRKYTMLQSRGKV